MEKLDIQGIIFDYGGTIDTNSRHWSEVLWDKYVNINVPIDKGSFREAYVYAERTLAKERIILPQHNFHEVLRIKTHLQIEYLIKQRKLNDQEAQKKAYATKIADQCYDYVLKTLERTRPVIQNLSKRYKLVLVSNFYGNIETILKDFKLSSFFSAIVESSVVGIRKPDPAIYQLGVDAIGYPANKIVVVGDSFTKDMVPAKKIGCQTVWLKGQGWGEEEIDESLPDIIITDLPDLLLYL